MNDTIYVLDAPMSSGKTTAIFNWMRNNPNKKYIYISPMLSEVEERVVDELASLEIVFPQVDGEHKTKGKSLLSLLEEGKNVSFTHSLFTSLTQEHLDLIKKWGYTLIIDEVPPMFTPYGGRYTEKDIKDLIENHTISVDREVDGRINWISKGDTFKEGTQYSELYEMCINGLLYCAKRDEGMLVVHLPVSLLTSAKECILCTYKFDKSFLYYFLKLKNLHSADVRELIPDIQLRMTEKQFLDKMQSLITIKSTPSTKKIKKEMKLSISRWAVLTKPQRLQITKAIYSLLNNKGVRKCMVAVPKENTEKNRACCIFDNRMSTDCYVYLGARATNKYSDRDLLIHGVDRYPNVRSRSYLQDYCQEALGTNLDDNFAIEELVQWVYRSAIRKDKPITIYFLSQRMENLFRNWMKNG